MQVIDLGEDWSIRPDRPDHARRRSAPRLVGLLAAAVLLTLLAGGSAVPQPSLVPIRLLAVGGSVNFQLTDDRVFTVRSQDGSPVVITAYRVTNGARLWQTTLNAGNEVLQPVPGAGVLLVWGGTSLTVLDVGTGQIRWQRAGVTGVEFLPDNQRMLLFSEDAGLQLLTIGSGQPDWSRQVSAGTNVTVALDSAGQHTLGWVVNWEPDGTIRILDEASGQTLRTGKLPASIGDPARSPEAVLGIDRLVLTFITAGDGTVITAYDSATLARTWQATIPEPSFRFGRCGPMICVGGTNLTAIDPATGSIRWRADTWAGAIWLPDTIPGGVLIVTGYRGSERLTLIEARSGKAHPIPGRWIPISDGPAGNLFAGYQVGRIGAWLGVLHQRTNTVRSVAWLPDVVRDQCQASTPEQTYLVCTTIHGAIQIWRYTPQ
ncbi:PQQ-binding-like beta-propeller repeat protein [Micromonospora cremea]|uniref:PQQ-like domain-containing protein n=1 Tax=Micromonospora cremea TaxID=709881 RepID=A0A1N6A8K8_9ACTN|nr:PQQ-binding-like beta-propeller repeat protein [Micromonospora cremea]SIN30383.1 PQQ-like domain-containing protein [Micromonospora cremea]